MASSSTYTDRPNSHPPDHDHPDAPLSTEPYRDEDCSGVSSYVSSRIPSLVEYEPRPIDENECGEEDEYHAESARPRRAWQAKLRVFWLRNKGMFFVLLAQAFGASMNVMTQILEIHSSLHPFQVGSSYTIYHLYQDGYIEGINEVICRSRSSDHTLFLSASSHHPLRVP